MLRISLTSSRRGLQQNATPIRYLWQWRWEIFMNTILRYRLLKGCLKATVTLLSVF